MRHEDRGYLVETYRRWQAELRQADWADAGLLTAPHLIDPTDRYLSAERRVLVLGQETRGWGWEASAEHVERAGLTGTVPEGVWDLRHFIPQEDGVEAMLAAYRAFAFATPYPRTRRSPFWTAFRRFDEVPRQAALWGNVCRCAFETEAGKNSIFRLPPNVLAELVLAQSTLARQEMEILKPDACVIVAGWWYDAILSEAFPGIRFEPVEDYHDRLLSHIVHPALPAETFRTYHPAYLSRLGKTDEILGKIVELTSPP